MAKELQFKLNGKDFAAAPVKLERKKIYGWTDIVATDMSGEVCGSAYLAPDDALIIPSGGLKQGVVNEDGLWVDKSELTAYNEEGTEVLPVLPSSFDAPIALKQKATIEEFPLVSLAEETTIDDTEEPVEEEIDELDFSMF